MYLRPICEGFEFDGDNDGNIRFQISVGEEEGERIKIVSLGIKKYYSRTDHSWCERCDSSVEY